jgi:hypothetical protein
MADIIIDFIVLLAIAGLVFQLKAFRRSRIDLDQLKRTQNVMGAMEIGEPIEVLISRAAASDRSIVGHRIHQVKDIARSPAPPSVADLSAADFERDDSRLESVFPNTLISILLIVGLAGTLLSFKTIIGDFPVGSKTTVEITNWMNKAYPAFGTAFFASLVGIGGTVFLLVFRSFVHNQRAELFDRLDRFTASQLYPRFVEHQATDSTTLALAGQQLLATAASFEQSVVKLEGIPHALTSATSGLAATADETRVALQTAAAMFSDFQAGFAEGGAVRVSLHRLEGTVSGFARQTEAATGTLRDAVSSATGALLGAANSVRQTGDSIAAVTGVIAAAGQNMEQFVAQILVGNTAHVEKMDALVLSIGRIVEATSRNQREWGEAISPAIRAMTESIGNLENSVDPLNKRTEALITAVEQIEKATAQFLVTGDSQAKRFEESAGKIEHALGESTSGQREFLEKSVAQLIWAGNTQATLFGATAETFGRDSKQSIVNQREFLKGLEPVLHDLPLQVLGFAQQQGELLGEIIAIGTELKTEIERLGMRAQSTKRGILQRLVFWRK